MADKNCPICKGTGFVDKGNVVEMCQCRFKEENFQRLLNIPKRFWSAEFDNYQPISPAQRRALEVCKEFVFNFDPRGGQGHYLSGTSSDGKNPFGSGCPKGTIQTKKGKGLFL
jgi:DNA replication protein DnaC